MKRASPDALQKALAGSAKPKKEVAPPLAANGAVAGDRQDRAGQRIVGAWFDKKVALQFQKLIVKRSEELDQKVSLKDLIKEAYNDLFEKYGMPPVA